MAQSGEKKDQKDAQKESSDESDSTSESLVSLIKQKLGLGDPNADIERVLEKPDFDSVVKFMKSEQCKNIITMAGAGISTSCGIPDFRSPGTGLYDNLAKYDLPHPQAVFDLGYFKMNPEPFFQLSKHLYPATLKPSLCHYFLRFLQDKGILLRHYTQNIDTLERVAGIDGEKLIEAHGTFHTGHCIKCRKEYGLDWMKEKIFADDIPRCVVEKCNGVVKPDIVFFGENLPEKFFSASSQDFSKCDLLIILGTSLVVQPFASLTERVPITCPRLYVNLEKAPGSGLLMSFLGSSQEFRFDKDDNYRDVFWQGSCDDGCLELARKLGWEDELMNLLKSEHARIDAEVNTSEKKLADIEDVKVKL